VVKITPGRFSPGKAPVPIVQEAGWPQGRFGRVQKISHPPGLNLQTIQPVANIYIYPICYSLTTYDNSFLVQIYTQTYCRQTNYLFSRTACNTSIDGFNMKSMTSVQCPLTAVNKTHTLRDCKTHKLTSVASTVVISNNLITVQ